jgi:hypothetical protein
MDPKGFGFCERIEENESGTLYEDDMHSTLRRRTPYLPAREVGVFYARQEARCVP